MEEMNQFLAGEETAVPSILSPNAAPVQPAATWKKEWKLQKHDLIFAWILLLIGFLFMRYVLVYADGVFTTCFFLLFHLCSSIYVRCSGCKPKLSHHILGCIIIAFSFLFSITASALLHGLCFVFLMLAEIWRTHAICGGASFVSRFFPFDLADSVFQKPSQHMSAGSQALSSSVKKSESTAKIKTALLGLLISVPLTFVVGMLLASADSGIEVMFSKCVTLITDHMLATCAEFLFGIPVGLWLFAMLYGAVQRRTLASPIPADAFYEQKLAAARTIPNLGLYAAVTPICVLYLAYVISQTNYFLSAFAGKLPEGMIYSEYARRGFFELCAIAVINLIVILVLTGCAKQGGSERPKALTVFAVILSLFTLFIIATAIAKMVLYISAYGMSRLRIYTAWFMILLAAVFLVMILRQFIKKLSTAAVLTGTFIVLFGVLCFSRPDAMIAEYNIRRYEQGTLNDLDVSMLCSLSEDAYVVMADHPETLKRAGQIDLFLEKANRIVDNYHENKDLSWNMPAQILIQLMHTDTGHGKLSDYANT